MAVSSTIVWISAAIVLQITPIIIDSVLGIAGYLCLLIGLTVLCFILVLLGLPETKVRIKDACNACDILTCNVLPIVFSQS